MKKTISYKELQRFDNVATNYLVRNGYFTPAQPAIGDKPAVPGTFTNKENTKLVANMRNIIKQAGKHFEEYGSLVDDLQLDHCSTDAKTNVILKDEKGNRMFTVEKEKALKVAIKKLAETTVEIHTRVTDGNFDLSEDELEAFAGLLIPEQIEA